MLIICKCFLFFLSEIYFMSINVLVNTPYSLFVKPSHYLFIACQLVHPWVPLNLFLLKLKGSLVNMITEKTFALV